MAHSAAARPHCWASARAKKHNVSRAHAPREAEHLTEAFPQHQELRSQYHVDVTKCQIILPRYERQTDGALPQERLSRSAGKVEKNKQEKKNYAAWWLFTRSVLARTQMVPLVEA